MNKSSIFSDPCEWAKKVIGTRFGYYRMIIITVLLGILELGFVFIGRHNLRAIDRLGISLFVTIISIVLPICYLTAMRCLFVKIDALKGVQSKNSSDGK